MPTFSLLTPAGEEKEVTLARIAAAFEAADRSADSAEFAVATSSDGRFVQLSAGGALEVGGDGPWPRRLDQAALAREIVARLERGEPAWGPLPAFDPPRDASTDGRARRASLVYGLIAVALIVASLGWLAASLFSGR